jgi:hypothetical protein
VNTCGRSPYVTCVLMRGWGCFLRTRFAFVKYMYRSSPYIMQVFRLHIYSTCRHDTDSGLHRKNVFKQCCVLHSCCETTAFFCRLVPTIKPDVIVLLLLSYVGYYILTVHRFDDLGIGLRFRKAHRSPCGQWLEQLCGASSLLSSCHRVIFPWRCLATLRCLSPAEILLL